jgi:hypothetical protein
VAAPPTAGELVSHYSIGYVRHWRLHGFNRFRTAQWVLVFAVFGIKVLCTVSIGRAERNLESLLRSLKEVQGNYDLVHERREAMDNMHSFHEKRKIDVNGEIEDLNEDLRELEAELEGQEAEDPEADQDFAHDDTAPAATGRPPPTQIVTESPPVETRTASSGFIAANDTIAVLPALIETPDDLFLPDTLADHLSEMGLNIVQRTNLAKKLEVRGVALSVALRSKEYLMLGDLGRLDKMALIRSTLEEGQVLQADCQIIDLLGDNKVVLQASAGSIGEPAERHPVQSLEKTARDMAEMINESVRA